MSARQFTDRITKAKLAKPVGRPMAGGRAPAKTADSAIVKTARQIAGLSIDPGIAAYNQQAKTVGSEGAALQQRTTGTYGNVAGLIQQVLAQNASGNTASADRTKAIGDSAQQKVAAGFQGAQDAMVKDQQTRGSGLDGGASAAMRDQAAEANARTVQDSQAAQTQGDAIGKSYQGLLSEMVASSGTRGAEAAGTIGYNTSKSLSDIASQKAALEGTRGALVAKTAQDLTQQNFENQATVEGLNLKSDSAAAQAAQAVAKLTQNASQFAVTSGISQQNANTAVTNSQTSAARAKTAADQGQQRIDATLHGQLLTHQDRLAGLADKGNLSPSQKLSLQKANGKIRASIQSAVSMLGYYAHSAKTTDGKNYTAAQQQASMLARFGNDADIVQAARELRKDHVLSRDTVAKLKARHIGIPKNWQKSTPAGGQTAGGTPGGGV